MIKVQDIQANDYDLYLQFLHYWQDGQYSSAMHLLMDGQLTNKAVIASLFNNAFGAVADLEGYYYNGVEQELSADLSDFDSRIEELSKRSIYNDDVVYHRGNIVLYDDDLYCYIYPVATSGNLPTDDTYWVLLSITGEQGAAGIGLNLRYNWASTGNYVVNDVVYYSKSMYYAKQPSTNIVPTPTSPYWGLLFTIPQGGIEFGTVAPSDKYYGQLWLQQM